MAEDAKEITSLDTKIIPCLHNLSYYWKECTCMRQFSVQPFSCPEYRQNTVPPQDNHDREEKVAASASQLPSTLPPLQDSIRAIAKRASKNTRRPRPLELSVPFIDPIEILVCDSSGKEFTNSDHGITLRVPEGAIPDGVTINIEVGVALHGPFQFPPGTRPISPIVWFCTQEGIPFRKPVEVILPHFLHNWEGLQLGFLKANHSTFTTDDGDEKRYMFQKLNDPTKFYSEDGQGFGALSTKHFCFLCIQSSITRGQLPSKARGQLHESVRYCLSPMLPAGWPDAQIARLYFCVTYNLPTCRMTVVQQCPREYRCTISKQFTFGDTEFGELEPKLQIEFDEPQAGWVACMAPESNKVIKASEVDFWDKNLEELQLMEKLRMYPPRFTTQVCGSSATGSSQLRVRFKGSCEDLSIEIQLPSIVYQRPKLRALLKFPTERGNINIPQQIGTNHNFGVFLLDDETGAIVDGIAQEHQGNSDTINKEILKKWLQGRGRQPVTWRTLIEVLRDSQLTELADEIQRNRS